MRLEVEQAFKWMDYGARLLGDMKHGIYEVKTHGGISEEEKMQALWGFCEQAEDIIKNMKQKIGEAQGVLDERQRTMDRSDLRSTDAQQSMAETGTDISPEA